MTPTPASASGPTLASVGLPAVATAGNALSGMPGMGDFAALLQGTDAPSVAEATPPAPAPPPPPPPAPEAAALMLKAMNVMAPGGNPGKTSGKTLPDAASDTAPDIAIAEDDDVAVPGAGTGLTPEPANPLMPPALALLLTLPDPAATAALPGPTTATAPGPSGVATATASSTANTLVAARPEPAPAPRGAAPSAFAATTASLRQQAVATLQLAPIEVVAETIARVDAKPAQPTLPAGPLVAAVAPVLAPASATPFDATNAGETTGHAQRGPARNPAIIAKAATGTGRDDPLAATSLASSVPTPPMPVASAPLAFAPAATPDGPASPAPAAEAPQDFATLVARLGEAREASQTSGGQHVVRTSLNHAEFGQVSLQFRQQADGMTVTLSGVDTGLAGAVQAAAASLVADTGNGEGRPREGQPHQPQSAPQPQSSGFASNAGPEGGRQDQQARAAEARRSGSASGATRDGHKADTGVPRDGTSSGNRAGGGIYA